jgi:hypothetical protein
MFITHEFYREGRPGFPGPGRIAWRMVELESMHPWYVVTIQLIEGTKRRSKKFMPTDAALLSDLLDLQNPTFLVDDVQVVTAPSVNRSPSERMEKLVSLVVGYDQRGGSVLLHKVASGVVYSSARDGLDAGSLTGIRTIYEDTKTAPSAVPEFADH